MLLTLQHTPGSAACRSSATSRGAPGFWIRDQDGTRFKSFYCFCCTCWVDAKFSATVSHGIWVLRENVQVTTKL